MTQDQVLLWAFRVVLVGGEVAALLWIGVYTYLARWWDNVIGKTVAKLALLLAAAFIPSILSLFFQFNRTTSHVAAWIDVALFGWIAVELARRTPMWIRLHLRADGTPSYTALRLFAVQVWQRRGRPLWWPERGPGGVSDPDTPPGP